MDPNIVHILNIVLGIGAIILQIFSFFVLLFFLFHSREKKNVILEFINRNFLLIGLIISSGAVIMSLFYSQIIGFLPCKLCWWQRIFLFPQVILFGIGYFKNDRKIINYSIPLLSIGILFSIYHNFIYYFPEGFTDCDVSGVSCVQRLVHEFGGYISFPSLSLTIFVSLLILLSVVFFYQKNNK